MNPIAIFSRSTEVIMKLQKTILSASFMEQPAFITKLMHIYIEFTYLLLNVNPKLNTALRTDLFQVKDFHLATIISNCCYKSIEITRLQSITLLLINVGLLTHAALEVIHFESDLLNKCFSCVMYALKMVNLHIKRKCKCEYHGMCKADSELCAIVTASQASDLQWIKPIRECNHWTTGECAHQ